jgi:hypothetical protein
MKGHDRTRQNMTGENMRGHDRTGQNMTNHDRRQRASTFQKRQFSKKTTAPDFPRKATGPHFSKQTKDNGPYHDTLIKFNHDSIYLGDEFISFSQIIIV